MVYIYHFITSPLCMFVWTIHCIRFASLIYRYLYILFTYVKLLFVKYMHPVQVPASLCSPECPVGHAKKSDGIHKCCFTCQMCPNGTYVNSTGK